MHKRGASASRGRLITHRIQKCEREENVWRQRFSTVTMKSVLFTVLFILRFEGKGDLAEAAKNIHFNNA